MTNAFGEAAIEGIEVCAEAAGGQEACAFTNSGGEYTVTGLAGGSYTVVFEPYELWSLYLTQYYSGKSSRSEAAGVSVTAGSPTSGIDARMVDGGEITGKVTNASGGAAIEEVDVCAEAVDSQEACAATNSGGEYTIPRLASGSYTVVFEPYQMWSLYLTQYYSGKSSRSEAAGVSVTAGSTTSGIDARMVEGGEITGKVTNASGGAAIEEIDVCAEAAGGQEACAATNSGGEYTLTGLASGSYEVEFKPLEESLNYLTQYYSGKSSRSEAAGVSVTAGSTTSGIDARMVEGGEITGKVTNASGGAAIERVDVCAEAAGGQEACAFTNSGGEYTITDLASGSYAVVFEPYELWSVYLTQYYNGKASSSEAEGVSVTAGSTTSAIDSRMVERGKITGKVTNASGEAAIEGIEVCAEAAGGQEACAFTNSGGEYTITGLASGSYTVEFKPREESLNYMTQYYSGKSSRSEAAGVSVTAGSTTSGIDARMVERGKITGKVTNASGGAAIEGIEVCAEALSGWEACVFTNSRGEYTIPRLASGSYTVVFEPYEVWSLYLTQYYSGKSSSSEAQRVSVTAGSTTPGIDARMVKDGEITGKVTNASGEAAIEGIEVCAEAAGGYWRCALTNPGGEYTIPRLASGSYTVEFMPREESLNYLAQYYNGKSSRSEAAGVSVTAGSTTSGIDARMVERGKITGKVTNASGGAAIEGIEVCAEAAGGQEACAFTNSGGEYTITGLASGSYTVVFEPYEVWSLYPTQYYGGKSSRSEAEKVSVTGGGTTSGIDARMVKGGEITGKVTNASARAAIEGIEVCAEAADGHWGCALTNSGGEYTIPRLASGSYTVVFDRYEVSSLYLTQYYSDKSSRSEAEGVSVTAEHITSGINARMAEHATITGRVTTASGEAALEGIEVCADAGGGQGACALTNTRGEYTIRGLASGSYTVEFKPREDSLNYLTQYYSGKSSRSEAEKVSVTEGTTSGIDARMVKGGEITGKVTNVSAGAGIEGIEVCAEAAGGQGPCAFTNSGGEYTIPRLASGSYEVKFRLYGESLNNLSQYYSGKFSRSEAQAVSVTAGNITSGIDATTTTSFTDVGQLPSGASFSSNFFGTQEADEPKVFFTEPGELSIPGCKGGYGVVYVTARNLLTGVLETRAVPLVETPANSGKYIATIPPLAPMYGSAAFDPHVWCPEPLHVLPDGGPISGGTRVLLTGSGFTGATTVYFGSQATASFSVTTDGLLIADAPPGVGTVPVTVITASHATVVVGRFTYFDVTGLAPTTGPATGGTMVTIHGHGFKDVTGVSFGLMHARSFTVVNEDEIDAEAPIGLGTVSVRVLESLAISQPSSATQYTYEGGPPGSSTIVEPIAGGGRPLDELARQVSTYCAQQDCGEFGLINQSANQDIALDFSSESASSTTVGSLGLEWFEGYVIGKDIGLLVCADPEDGLCEAFEVYEALDGVYEAIDDLLDAAHVCVHIGTSDLIGCNFLIDPSGTVIDTTGKPVSNATVTLLGQAGGGGPFSPIPPLSGAIEPATNPERTSASGQFDWNALAGTYEVEASAPGCSEPGDASQSSVFTSPFVIPPPAVGLMLMLECPGIRPPAPSVTGLSPARGVTAGGNTVEIMGEGLAGTTAVRFGRRPASYIKTLSPNAVEALAPAGTATVDVTVVTPGGTSATGETDKYSYFAPSVLPGGPVISSVTPGGGSVSGGTQVTIRGEDLTRALAVDFGGIPSDQVTSVSSTEVQAVAPAAALPLRVGVSVTTPDGSSAPRPTSGYVYAAQQYQEQDGKRQEEEAAGKEHQEEEAAARRRQEGEAAGEKHQEEQASGKKRPEETTDKAGGGSVKLEKLRVERGSITLTIKISQAGTVTISGPGLRRTVKRLSSGSHTVKVRLTTAGRAARRKGEKIKLAVSLRIGSRTVAISKRIEL